MIPHAVPSTQYSVLSALRTPETAPYTDRRYAGATERDDPRSAFAHDRDRIIHADAFRRLQHKTQVLVVSEGDFFRTRLTHTLEVAQIGRSLAALLGLSEPLTEAICLAHDLGHTPFGHTGETTMNALLHDHGGWDSNQHSLTVVEEIETNYPDHPGLDLTWACREGIARHFTPFDNPHDSRRVRRHAAGRAGSAGVQPRGRDRLRHARCAGCD